MKTDPHTTPSAEALSELQSRAIQLDATDPLAWAATEFVLPAGITYLDGNSLGALPRTAIAAVARTTEIEWGQSLIRSWNEHGWFNKPITVGEKLAPLIGAGPGQVLVSDTISINLFKLLHAAMGLRPERSIVLAEATSFPTDLYMTQAVVDQLPGTKLILATDAHDLSKHLISEGAQIAVVLLNHADFRSGRLQDMGSITALAQSHGVLTIWDLAHTAGALPIGLDVANVDFALGCTYKYLNGGPGAPGFLYVATRHQDSVSQPLTGWWGHADPFSFNNSYTPAPGVLRFATGTQPMISFAALEASLELWARVDMDELRRKSLALTDLFIEAVGVLNSDPDLILGTPINHAERGSHVNYHYQNGYPVMQALIAEGVIGDFRDPDGLRFGFTPLYNSYADAIRAAATLCRIVADRSWDQAEFTTRHSVT